LRAQFVVHSSQRRYGDVRATFAKNIAGKSHDGFLTRKKEARR
jgi:hypothetical protein